MWKVGIWRGEQLNTPAAATTRRPLSLGLLAIGKSASAEEVRRFELVQVSMETSVGICRTTYRKRMQDVNQWAAGWIRSRYGTGNRVMVADWAASDCLAASEWAGEVLKEWPGGELTASDLLLNVQEWKSGEEAYYLQSDGKALQYVRPPFVISLERPLRVIYVWNRWLFSRAKRDMPQFGEAKGDQWDQDGKHWKRQLLSLVHPEARQLAAQDSRFRIQQHSLFDTASQPVEVLRTMNVLNNIYMDRATMERGVRAIHGSLVKNGLWIVGRTTEERVKKVNQVTLYERSENGFKRIDQLNGGSEIEPVVEGWRA